MPYTPRLDAGAQTPRLDAGAQTPRLDAGPTRAGSQSIANKRTADTDAKNRMNTKRTLQRKYRRAVRNDDYRAAAEITGLLDSSFGGGAGGGGGIAQSEANTGVAEGLAFADADNKRQIAGGGDPNEKQGQAMADAPPAPDKGRTEGASEPYGAHEQEGQGNRPASPQESPEESSEAIADSADNDYFSKLPQTPRNEYIQNANDAFSGDEPIGAERMSEIKRQGEAFGITGEQIEARYAKAQGIEAPDKPAPKLSAREKLLAKKTAEVQARSDKRIAAAQERDKRGELVSDYIEETSPKEVPSGFFGEAGPGLSGDGEAFNFTDAPGEIKLRGDIEAEREAKANQTPIKRVEKQKNDFITQSIIDSWDGLKGNVSGMAKMVGSDLDAGAAEIRSGYLNSTVKPRAALEQFFDGGTAKSTWQETKDEFSKGYEKKISEKEDEANLALQVSSADDTRHDELYKSNKKLRKQREEEAKIEKLTKEQERLKKSKELFAAADATWGKPTQ